MDFASRAPNIEPSLCCEVALVVEARESGLLCAEIDVCERWNRAAMIREKTVSCLPGG